MPQQVKEEEMLTVKEIWEELGRKVSIRQIYNLIERRELQPIFRLAGRYGTCVPKTAVLEYKARCLVSMEI